MPFADRLLFPRKKVESEGKPISFHTWRRIIPIRVGKIDHALTSDQFLIAHGLVLDAMTHLVPPNARFRALSILRPFQRN